MEISETKKISLLAILRILKAESDVDHPLTHGDIIDILDRDYGVKIERKAVGRNIAILNEIGYETETTKKGSYLLSRKFEDSELHLLIDCVLSSNYISEKHSADLIEKIAGLSNKYFNSRVAYKYSVNEWNKTDNKTLFYNIEQIDEAIGNGRQIRFEYYKYGTDKKLQRTSLNVLSPYQMIVHNQKYYLMGYNEKWKNIVFYRMDRIRNLNLTDDTVTPLNSLEGYENGIDYKMFSSYMPYMFADKPKRVEMIVKENVIDDVIDWFGKDVSVAKYGVDYYVGVTASENAMEYWAMQYLNSVEIIKPQSLREKIKNNLAAASEKYNQQP
ncbi:MAG: WYL domain-containing protein [Clostridia bacterium]|nr:WYL domain-containing protein [Clostridia bacterium]